jgi:hypothetical protein
MDGEYKNILRELKKIKKKESIAYLNSFSSSYSSSLYLNIVL